MIKKIFNKQENYQKTSIPPSLQNAKEQVAKKSLEFKSSLFYSNQIASWTDASYVNFANNGYIKNVIAYRCVHMIARQASFIPIKLYKLTPNGERVLQKNHFVNDILAKPNPSQNYTNFMEELYSNLLIYGNAYLVLSKNSFAGPSGLELIKPEKINILTDRGDNIIYRYKDGQKIHDYSVNLKTNKRDILHIKLYNPSNEFYGLSPFEVATYPIDQHNESSRYNKSLLQNCARPSGAIVFTPQNDGTSNTLTEDQYQRLQEQINENFLKNTGRPILLEGGLDWKEMSISPKEMDFLECRQNAAREIALAFGVPPQLLGIKGDATYNNMMEARLVLWEQTIIPFINLVTNALEDFLSSNFDEKLDIDFDMDKVATLSSKRDSEWMKVANASFMTINEKRQFVGLDPIMGGDVFESKSASSNVKTA